jgi:hypothetical protein
MKDMLGTEVQVGDIIMSAGTATGRAKLGKVYGFDRNGWPMVKYPESDRRTRKQIWKKSSAGFHILVLRADVPFAIPQPLIDRLYMDYEADAPNLG